MNDLRTLVAIGAFDAELAALVWLLAERGLPLVVAAQEPVQAERVRAAISAPVLAGQRSRDTLAGGVVIGGSLEDVLRRLGAAQITDETRDLGLVLVVSDGVVTAAHYVRPVERDGAGHLQRRPPTLLGAWNASSIALDLFYWAVTDELATRAGMERHALEAEVESRRRALGGDALAAPNPDARN